MLEANIPDEVERSDVGELYRERLPNYCHECGGEVVVAGGRLRPETGWYEHLDPVLTCERACWKDRFTAGLNKSEGQQYRVAPGAEGWDDLFGDVTGWCDLHRTGMKVTKDLYLEDQPVRQWKCPECSREFTAVFEG